MKKKAYIPPKVTVVKLKARTVLLEASGNIHRFGLGDLFSDYRDA